MGGGGQAAEERAQEAETATRAAEADVSRLRELNGVVQRKVPISPHQSLRDLLKPYLVQLSCLLRPEAPYLVFDCPWPDPNVLLPRSVGGVHVL